MYLPCYEQKKKEIGKKLLEENILKNYSKKTQKSQ